MNQILLAQTCPPRPTASLRLNNNDICGDQPIMVTNNSEENGNSVFYVWDWGDGTRDTVQDRSTPVHRYRDRADLCSQSNDGQAYILLLKIINRNPACQGHQAQTEIYAYARPRADFEAPAEICIDNPVAFFTNKTCPRTTPNTTYTWDFGDPMSGAANRSTDKDPNHRYSALGTYTVTLTVNSVCGSTTFQKQITVREPAVIAVNYTPPANSCGPFSIQFQNRSTGQSGNWWQVLGAADTAITEGFSFLNGTMQNSLSPTIRFDKKGTYKIRLIINSPCGEKTWLSQTIRVSTVPKVAVDTIPSACIPYAVRPIGRLLDDGGDTPPQYNWQFTGANPSAAVGFTPPEINYTVAGTYTLQFNAVNTCGTGTATFTLLLNDKIRPTFPGLVSQFCNTDTAFYTFRAEPMGGTWSGAAITAAGVFRPSVVGTGVYAVRYSVIQGSCRGDTSINLTVGGSSVSAGAPQEICGTQNLLILRGGIPTGGIWRGLGVVDSVAGLFNPALTGLGSFELTYSFGTAASTCVNSATKTVTVKPRPIARLDTLADDLCVNIPQVFKHKSSNITRFDWQFNPSANSNLEMPTYAYTAAGNYTLRLVVTNREACTDTISKAISVNVPPIVRFSLSNTEGCSPLDVSFTNTSTGSTRTGFQWQFGNGTTANVRTPNAQTFYNRSLADTTYQIRLLGTTPGCPTVIDSARLTLFTLPKARFGVDVDTGCSPMTVRFTNISTGSPRQFQWDFGNNRAATTEIPPTQTYTTDSILRSYIIRLAVANTCGRDSFEKKIVVRPSATRPFFSLSRTEGCSPLTVSLQNFAAAGATVTYDFGDGNRYTTPNPIYTFNKAGVYTITQYASGVCGFDSTKRTVTVFASPSVDFTWSQNNSCRERKISFRNLSTPTNLNLTWDFGDSTQSGASNPVKDYRKSGTYRVILSATNAANGCQAADTATVEVVAPLVFSVDSIKNATCFGIDDGAIVILQGGVTGGSRVYEFSLNDSTFQKINRSGVFSNLKGRQFYEVWVRDTAGCVDSARVFVGGLPPLSIDAGGDRTIELGDSVQIFVAGNRSEKLKVKWSPPRGLRCDTCTAVWARPFETTVYTIQATDANGCTERSLLTLTVNKNLKIFVPSVFSPNDDGINDKLEPHIGSNVLKVNYFRVFDRWGSLLYQAENFTPNDPSVGWDGRWRGKRAETGVYVFLMAVELITGQKEILKGDFNLIR
jgi:gliding motility-associated-like protein